jgi:hypothetical protein
MLLKILVVLVVEEQVEGALMILPLTPMVEGTEDRVQFGL